MERVILRHLKGSKASQIEEFPLDEFDEMILGRDPSASVRFDAELDDLVGRQHARISRDRNNRYQFTVVDMNSRNGTFVNKQRITDATVLSPGDVVQLGAGGPEIQFDIDPLPAQLVKATRIAGVAADAPESALAATRSAGPESGAALSGPLPTKPFYGKETVMRIIGQTKHDSRRNLMYVAAAAAVLLAGTVGWQAWNTEATADVVRSELERQNTETRENLEQVANTARTAAERSSAMTPAEIATKYAAAVVQIEFSWKLIHTGNAGVVYHEFVPNVVQDEQGNELPIIDNGRQMIPAYVMIGDREWEPLLTMERGQANRPIGASSGGTGFVVQKNGYILTNRHVAANWRTWYRNWDQRADIGVLLNTQGQMMTSADGSPVTVPPPSRWVPDETKQDGPKGVMGRYQAQVEYLYASFPKNTLRRPATDAGVSDRHDLALIKIDVAQDSLPTVELYDNYDKIGVGDAVTVMGYPAVSDYVIAVLKSKDTFNREAQQRIVPDPTLSTGNIGKILRAADGPVDDASYTYAPFGDRYQLTINSTGGGNSGGPMFDAYGRVVGVYFAGRAMDAQVSFAVPVRYALELLSVTPNTL